MVRDRLSNLLTALYGAALQPELWREALGELCRVANVPQAALIEHRNNQHRILAFHGDGLVEGGPVYEEHYWPFDEWTRRFPKRPLFGRVLRGQELWPEDEFRRSLYYNEFLLKYDVCETP